MGRCVRTLLAVLGLGVGLACAQSIVNGGFEEADSTPPEGCRRFFARGWTVYLNSGAAHCDARLSDDSLEGARSLELINLSADRFISAAQTVPLSPGREVSAAVHVKGTPGARCLMRFYFLDVDGERVGPYKTMGSSSVSPEWKRRQTRFIVPAGVAAMQVTVENLKSTQPASVFFDGYELSFAAGTLLENAVVRARVDPLVGGCLGSFVLRRCGDVDLTRPNSVNAPGGLAVDMIPGDEFPGLLRAARYEWEVLEPLRRIRVRAQLRQGALDGLRLTKEFHLPEAAAGVSVAVTLENTGANELRFVYRVQNVLRTGNGICTWPTTDWLQLHRRELDAGTHLESLRTANMRSGWLARTFEAGPHGVVCAFDHAQLRDTYAYFGEQIETAEWYYRPIALGPGATWRTSFGIRGIGVGGAVFHAEDRLALAVNPAEFPTGSCTVTVSALRGRVKDTLTVNGTTHDVTLGAGETATLDVPGPVPGVRAVIGSAIAEVGRVYPIETVRGVELPEPPPASPRLPAVMQDFFPYGIDSPPIAFPEAAGGHEDALENLYSRILREARRAYFNLFYNSRMIQRGYIETLLTPDGKHAFGELARDYRMMFATNSALFRREDVDLEPFREDLRKRLDFSFGPVTQRFLTDYADRFLCHFTADETLAKNIPAMLVAHDSLRAITPDRVAFPYLNLNRYEYAPYVPVYLGDFYPIKRKESGGRNPWSMQHAMRAAVEHAGPGVPVWLMAQAFAYFRRTYAFPTAAEMRLMLYGAVAEGCKGITFHGWAGEIPWRTKYGYHYSYFAMAPTEPLWSAIAECGRELTAVGALLYGAQPAPVPPGASVTCREFRAHDGFYVGAALSLHSLAEKAETGGRLLLVLNQNDHAHEQGALRVRGGPGVTLFDLSEMRAVADMKEVPVEIVPGGCRMFFLGPDARARAAADDVFRARYEAERVRYGMDAGLAASNGVAIDGAERLAAGASEARGGADAYRGIRAAQRELSRILADRELGRDLAAADRALEALGRATFMFRTHFDLVVPPDLYEAAKRYRRMTNTRSPDMQAHVDAVARDYQQYWRLERQVYAGHHARVAGELRALIGQMERDAGTAIEYLRANEHMITPDRPYE